MWNKMCPLRDARWHKLQIHKDIFTLWWEEMNWSEMVLNMKRTSFFSSFFKSCSWEFFCNKSCVSPASIQPTGHFTTLLVTHRTNTWIKKKEANYWLKLINIRRDTEVFSKILWCSNDFGVWNENTASIKISVKGNWSSSLRLSGGIISEDHTFFIRHVSLQSECLRAGVLGEVDAPCRKGREGKRVNGAVQGSFGDLWERSVEICWLWLKATSGSDCKRSARHVSVQSSLLMIQRGKIWSRCLISEEYICYRLNCDPMKFVSVSV